MHSLMAASGPRLLETCYDYVYRVGEHAEDTKTSTVRQSRSLSMLSNPASQQTRK